MLPKYELFVSLLTGTWMPWLENNRQPGRFDSLLQNFHPTDSRSCPVFFRMLARQSGRSHSPAARRFNQEVLHLADACADAADDRENLFFSLPASTSRQQFYNRLIACSFTGYDAWAAKELSTSQARVTTGWYHMRMTATLLELVKCPLSFPHAEHPERVIAGRALAALCILLHRLTAAGTRIHGTRHPDLNLRSILQARLNSFCIEAPACLEILELFDGLTRAVKPPSQAPAAPGPAQPAANQVPKDTPDEEPILAALIKEMKLDFDSIRQAVSSLMNPTSPAAEKPGVKPEQYLDSGTVMKKLSIGSTTLQRYRERGMLPFTRIGGKYCYSVTDVTNLVEEGKNQKKNPPRNRGRRKPDN